jgi:GDP-L-fucose synthase
MSENENKKRSVILVTGGSGLVGNAIKLKSKNYEDDDFIFLSSKDGDLSDINQTLDIFKKYKPNVVIHLAACVGGLYKNMNNKVEMFEKNIAINYNVIKCAYDCNVDKLVACLSTCIFPDKIENYPITEDMLHDGAPHYSNYTYAYAKRMLEIHCRAYRENFNKKFICVTPTNIYGPYDNFHLEDAHVLPALIHRCFLSKKNNTDFVVRGTGKAMRQFIFSEDLAENILFIMKHSDEPNTILSVSEEDNISIAEIAKIIAREYNYEDRLVFDDSYADGQLIKTVTNKKLQELYLKHATPLVFTSIETGIKKTIQWFNENQNNLTLKI